MSFSDDWTAILLVALLFVVTAFYLKAVRDGKKLKADLVRDRESLWEKDWALRAVLDTVPAAINLRDEHGRYKFVNKGLAGLYGMTPAEAAAKWNHDLDEPSGDEPRRPVGAEYSYDHSASAAQNRAVLETGEPMEFDDTEYDLGNRREVWTSSKLPLVEPRTGIRYVLTVAFDVTRQRETEEKLRQSQKMEAVGQLTGGIAHDFNNLLTIIIGNLELELEAGPGDQRRIDRIRNAMEAAGRGAGLTHRLLAFARQQPLNPKSIDLNQVIGGMRSLLARTLGEQVEIEIVAAGGLWHCVADPSQVESAILNLAINARDAMPEGGRLTIETANARLDEDYAAAHVEVAPGQYVMIAVTDNGTGMTEEVKRKAFDPFFTTKGVGKGSGLGLAMIYGFAKQSGGHIKIYSEAGQGTSVKIYLPRSHAGSQVAHAETSDGALQRGQGQVVLVVEDDRNVRRLAVTFLEDLGYRVIEAADGAAALAAAEAHQQVDLLLTDVVLPGGMDGRQLSVALRQKRPVLRLLFMSGYTANAIVHHGRVDPDVQLLQKPFRKRDLARAIRTALES